MTFSTVSAKALSSRKQRKRPAYNHSLKQLEDQLKSWRLTLAQQQQQQLELQELNLILCDMLHTQQRLVSIYDKQQCLLAAHTTREGGLTQDHQKLAGEPEAGWHIGSPSLSQLFPNTHADDRDSHWVLFLLESCSLEDLLLAKSMNSSDWVSFQKQFFARLLELQELAQLVPEVQEGILTKDMTALPAEQLPAAYPAVSLAAGSSDAEASSYTSQDVSAACRMLTYVLTSSGRLFYAALLHGMGPIFEAAGRNLSTGAMEAAPPSHWLQVARRMNFSKSQRLHFKLALQNFGRQARESASRGQMLLQNSASCAFLLACQSITQQQEQQSSDSPDNSPQQLSHVMEISMEGQNNSRNVARDASAEALLQHRSVSRNDATGTARSMSPSCSAQITPSPSSGAATQLNGSEPHAIDADVIASESPDAGLQRLISLYVRNVIALNIFLAESLSLRQALVLNVASYPYFPMLSAIAEAALLLPDDEDGGASSQTCDDPVHLRRMFMQHIHNNFWEESDAADNRASLNGNPWGKE